MTAFEESFKIDGQTPKLCFVPFPPIPLCLERPWLIGYWNRLKDSGIGLLRNREFTSVLYRDCFVSNNIWLALTVVVRIILFF